MEALLADRFVAFGRTWIDVASGAPVHMRFEPAGHVLDQIVWSDQCAERARLRHPLLNALVDYGLADNARTFEAYATCAPLSVSGAAASELLQHAARFMASRGLPVSEGRAQAALREVVCGWVRLNGASRGSQLHLERRSSRPRSSRNRALGLILQPRDVLESFRETLEVAIPGSSSLEIAGGRGSGLRTARLLAARTARLAGFVPVASSVLVRVPWLRTLLAGRHLCVLLDDHLPGERAALAMCLCQLGTSSARRHVLLRFTRTEAPAPGARWIDSMGLAAMTSMVFVDGDNGPSPTELFDAARRADGRPGVFLERLRAGYASDERPPRIAVVHESSPAYVFDARPSGPTARGVGRVLRDAPERGARLSARGRHASAVRLLVRASRVLEARGEQALAAACAEQLAWVLRDRGQSDRALVQFERARALSGDGPAAVSAVVGIGITWTDQRRLEEAEASLRGAVAAAAILGDLGLQGRAERALARCLFWQSRYDEAVVALEGIVARAATAAHTEDMVEAWALLARTRAAQRELRPALAAAGEAVARAAPLDSSRPVVAALRSMAIVQGLVGDGEQVRVWAERALRSASTAHLPLAGLRARCLLVMRSGAQSSSRAARWLGHIRAALTRRSLPGLLRRQLEEACAEDLAPGRRAVYSSASERSLLDLPALLELAHMAADERAALDSVCQFVCDHLRAASVQIVTGPPASQTVARAGRPWPCDPAVVARVLAAGAAGAGSARGAGSPITSGDPRQAAEPVCFGQEAIAVLCCRWTMGTVVEDGRAAALLRAAALAAASSVRSVLECPTPLEPTAGFSEILGSSEAAVALRAAVQRAARSPFPVLVEGESGTGKELVARGVHRLGPRRDRRLCTINCAALSDDLLEAELFGHARGAFTGAVGDRAGLFEEADGGSIFLDEVGELSPRAQAKLLRVLQEGEVKRVGENMPRRVDARVVAATNRRLDEEAAANRFRADLRFRLDVVRIVVPPLRDRASDIPALAMHFWTESAARVGTSATLTPDTLSMLARYDWPGNVRELQNVIAALAVHAPRRGRIVPGQLPVHIASTAAAGATTFEAARHEFERRYVRAALANAGGQRTRAARTLGLSRQGLAKVIRRLQIDESS